MPKVVLIIQARMGSKRLPGKSTLPLAGVPMIGRILERVKRCRKVDDIVLAIPDNKENDILQKIGKNYHVCIFRGSENNLLERFYKSALMHSADYVVRLPADNATPEPNEIDKIISYHLKLKRRGFSSNLSSFFNSGYPDGIGAEIFNFTLLEEVYLKGKVEEKDKMEHVHLNFFDYSTQKEKDPFWCPVSTIKCPEEYSRPDLVLDVNTFSQYEFMKQLYDYLYKINPNFTIIDIVNWYDAIYINEPNN